MVKQDLWTETTQSQVSEESVFIMSKLGRHNYFLSASNFSPLKQLQSKLDIFCDLLKCQYRLKADKCVETALHTVCPGKVL